MKRDWELIRQVLVDIEDDRDPMLRLPDNPVWENQTEQEFSDEVSRYRSTESSLYGHVELLLEANCIQGMEIIRYPDDSWGHSNYGARLTMAGHDLLETMRSQGLWEKIKTTAKTRSIELTVDSIKTIATALITKAVA